MSSTIVERLKSPTPKFFKIIRNIGATVVALSVLAEMLKAQGIPIPEIIFDIFNYYTLSAGAVAAFISQLTKIWSDEEQEAFEALSDEIEYEIVTQSQRLDLDTETLGVDYFVYQIDALAGFYQINIDLKWEYVGTRPPRRPK